MQHATTPSYAVGVDIGGTKVFIVITDAGGKVFYKEKFRTPAAVGALIQRIADCISESGVNRTMVGGLGVGVPGRVDSRRGIVIDVPSLKWHNLPLQSLFEQQFNVPVFFNNDVNLSLLGERWLGSGQNVQDLYYLAIGTGVGSAIFANGQLIEGASFSAGEIGYFLEKADLAYSFKNRNTEFGIFENKTSGTALTHQGLKLGYDPRQLFERYVQGDSGTVAIIEEFITDLSLAIANVVSLLNPQLVIVGGGVSESMACVIGAIRRNVKEFSPIPTQIELAKLGGEAGAFGGAAYVFQKLND